MRNRWVRLLTAASLLTLAGALPAASATSPQAPTIEVLGTRADLVSGGDALVQIGLPPGASVGDLRVWVAGRDLSESFASRPNGLVQGLVDGLKVGTSKLLASVAGGGAAMLAITNHPIGGPLVSGPQVQPWQCNTVERGLGPALDAQCNAPAKHEFFYKSAASGQFTAYDPANPPPAIAIANTTTDQGKTRPYIIRHETGTQNRGIYQIAVLFDPAKPWQPWTPQDGWNGKLFYPFGAGCGTYHQQAPGGLTNVQDDNALRRGFMVATSSMNKLGEHCNTAAGAESVMMVKERITEQYGPIRYTFGKGGSGGSIGQQEIANGYPGLLQGLLPDSSFSDVWTGVFFEVYDCALLSRYYQSVSPLLWADPTDQAAVNGMESITTCAVWEATFGNADGGAEYPEGTSPEPGGCGANDAQFEMYEPTTRPHGCRGTFQDYNAQVFGPRPPALWTAAEKRAGFGFTKLPWDNTGVQYGLAPLRTGQIDAEQFVDLNEKIGGFDIDWNHQPARTVADPGSVAAAYRSGRVVDDTRQLDQVAIIDVRPANNGGLAEIHTSYHSWSTKERIVRAHGAAPNHVIWTNGNPPGANTFVTMDRWLAAVEADTSSDPLPVKLARNKPAVAVDACFAGGGPITDKQQCRTLFPYYGSARTAAAGGQYIANAIVKCQLAPLNRADYPVQFTDAQWQRLQGTFPDGVCDWSRQSVEQVASVPWLTYAEGPGGQPLGPPPTAAQH